MPVTLWDWLGRPPHREWQAMPLDAMTFFATLAQHLPTNTDADPATLETRLRVDPSIELLLSDAQAAALDQAYATYRLRMRSLVLMEETNGGVSDLTRAQIQGRLDRINAVPEAWTVEPQPGGTLELTAFDRWGHMVSRVRFLDPISAAEFFLRVRDDLRVLLDANERQRQSNVQLRERAEVLETKLDTLSTRLDQMEDELGALGMGEDW